MSKKIVVFGTRPEFIKILPIILEVKARNIENNYCFIYTGQHNNLISNLFDTFNFTPNYSIKFKNQKNSISYSFTHILSNLQVIIDEIKNKFTISIIIGQGDTTSCLCAGLCSFFNQIPFGHIEAGLRTNNLMNPYPEELFRKIISLTSTINFAPTVRAQNNLLREGVKKENILITGNTIVDAIEILKTETLNNISENSIMRKFTSKNNVLITCHRRENQNEKFNELINAVKTLATENSSLNFIWISHATPFVKKNLTKNNFSSNKNIHVLSPLNIFELFFLYHKTLVVITDSGGIQEEAPSFNIPVLIIRDYTERNESVEMGYSQIVGLNYEKLINSFNKIIHKKAIKMINPYGKGNAAQLIVNYLNETF